ncbi:MAG: acyclic terpene utilization AtuA family protein [Chloroflexi bacterium]|nr:acyclic terpene utilization AtuA family protein [Chloroflexota bacterium]
MKPILAVAATGMLGSGFREESYLAALAERPDFVACDSGSTDPGPYLLGSGKPYQSRIACKRDLRVMLRGAVPLGIPVIVGSAGGAGTDQHVDWMKDIVREIAAEGRLSFRLALIRAEQEPDYLKRKLAEGRIRPLDPAPEISAEVIDRSAHIVAMMGAEPIQRAIADGAQVVVTGRSSDTSIFAAIPLMRGAAPGASWHAAKILECGAAAVEQRSAPDCMMAYIDADSFLMRPPNPSLRCSPVSVAAHTLYENASPFHLYEPSGMLDTTGANYEPADDRSVRVTGSQFVPAERYTVKLEGAELVGYQAITIAGIRDSVVLGQIDEFLAVVRRRAESRIAEAFAGELDSNSYTLRFRVYGKNGSMGQLEPVEEIRGHEVCLLMEAVAPTQEIASAVVGAAEYIALHNPIPQWRGSITNLAFPFAPSVTERGAVYRFNLNHLLEPEHPLEPFRIEHHEF